MDFSLVLAATEAEPSTLMYVLGVLWIILKVAIGLGFVIFVHELGHFLVAKACGVKCEKFYVGFDFFELKLGPIKIPRALCKFQWGETEYGIGILPLGGYVKMLGQDDDPRNAEKEAERTKVADEDSAVAAPGEPSVPAKTSDGKTIQLDPRSYPAKSIPARMAIISAGVIMNVIFGVIMAAIAYRMGVPEMPAVIGGTSPGSPAWVANIQPGSKVIQIGKNSKPYDHLRYVDLIRGVVLNGADRPLQMTFVTADGQKVVHEIQPTDRLEPITDNPTIGVAIQPSRDLQRTVKALEHLSAKTSPEIVTGDKIVAINGQKIEGEHEVLEHLARNPSGKLTLRVSRQEEPKSNDPPDAKPVFKEMDIEVSPLPVRETGAVMKIGPITSIRTGSPAAGSGLQIGDTIVEVNGEPVGDPLSLGQRLAAMSPSEEPIEIKVVRRDSENRESTKTFSIAPEIVRQFHEDYPFGGPSAIESIGVAYNVTRVVSEVKPDSPADKAGLQPGDVLTTIQFVPPNEERRKELIELLEDKEVFDPLALDDDLKAWTYAFHRMQMMPPDVKVKLSWSRSGKAQQAELVPQTASDFFLESRGLMFRPQRVIHRAEDWSSAFSLGWREITENLKEVLQVLQRLITGRISATKLSGPLGIVGMAGSFASEGIPMLLIFLTMLSANLAVLNFLPIPALDGGHMLFLAAEGIRGRPVDERLQIRLTIAGVLCLLGLMVFATLMDLNRFLS